MDWHTAPVWIGLVLSLLTALVTLFAAEKISTKYKLLGALAILLVVALSLLLYRYSISGYGPCNIRPLQRSELGKLRFNLEQGLSLASEGKFENARDNFRQALTIDRHFLGLRQNIGAADLALNEFDSADASLTGELELTHCLTKMSDSDLANFSYFVNPDQMTSKTAVVPQIREALKRTEAEVYYNLACLRARQNSPAQALSALEKATSLHKFSKSELKTDPDLTSLKDTQEFKKILSSATK